MCRRDKIQKIVIHTSHHTHYVIGTGANDPQKMWDVARERLQFVVDVWGDSQLASTCLGSFVAGKRTAPYAPQGLRAAVEQLAVKYPGPAPMDKLNADSSLEARVASLVQDFIDYPAFAAYWRDQFVPVFLREAALDQPWRFA